MKKSLKLAAAAFSLSMLPLLPVPVFAQVSSATITGAVRDSSGGVIPHAKVTATETATGVKTVAETNGSGEYTLPLLKPGTYSITAEFHGFNRYEQRGLALSSGDHPTIDIPLVVGDTTQTIQVTSAAPLLGTEDANVGQVSHTAERSAVHCGRRCDDEPGWGAAFRQFGRGCVLRGWPAQQELGNSDGRFARQCV
jgi:hypothetical protein